MLKNSRWLKPSLLVLFSLCAALPLHAGKYDLEESYAQIQKEVEKINENRAAAEKKQAALVPIVIYHTNDIHGAIGPTPANPKTGARASGGAASLATLLKNESRPRLWIDSGDWFQGTPEGNLTKGSAVIGVFNALKLDAGVIGNHDYDYGQDNAERLAGEAEFAVLGANVSSLKTGEQAGYLKPYVIKEVAGVKIGILGLLTQQMDKLAFPESIKGTGFGREADAAAKAVAELKARGAAVIIAATHMGVEQYGEKTYSGIGEGDIFLANNVPGIDLILGGHTHTDMKKPVIIEVSGRRTIITQTRGKLSSVYQITLYVDAEAGRLDHADARLIDLDPAQYPPDAETEKLIAGYKALVDKEMSRPIGSSAAAMPRNPNGESAVANWVSDILRSHGQTDIGLINTFGILADLPGGPLTYGDVYKVMPFDNRITKFEISGSELKRLVERNITPDVLWLQYSGMRITYDLKAPAGQRLKSLSVGGAAVEDQKVYTVTTLDFIATVDKAFKGNESSKEIEKKITENSPVLARDLLVEEIRSHSPVSPKWDGRIKAIPTGASTPADSKGP